MLYGEYIKKKRIEKGFSQRKLGLESGISNTTISRIENNETPFPEIDTLKSIEKALSLEENEIVYIAYPELKKENNKNKNSGNEITNEIIKFLVAKGIVEEGEELSDEKREWLFKLLDKAIDLSRM